MRNVSFLKVHSASANGRNARLTQIRRASNALRSISHGAPGFTCVRSVHTMGEKASLLFGIHIVVRPLFDLQTVRCCFHGVDVLMEDAALASRSPMALRLVDPRARIPAGSPRGPWGRGGNSFEGGARGASPRMETQLWASSRPEHSGGLVPFPWVRPEIAKLFSIPRIYDSTTVDLGQSKEI